MMVKIVKRRKYFPSQFSFCAHCGRPKWAGHDSSICRRCYRGTAKVEPIKQKAKVIDALCEFADTSIEIAEMTGLSVANVTSALRQLEKDGIAKRTKRYRWERGDIWGGKSGRKIQCWALAGDENVRRAATNTVRAGELRR